jgi:hypothetical protein
MTENVEKIQCQTSRNTLPNVEKIQCQTSSNTLPNVEKIYCSLIILILLTPNTSSNKSPTSPKMVQNKNIK